MIDARRATPGAAARGADTALQRRLARSIADLLKADGLKPGAPVNQLALARRLGVSRTPIRAALKLLRDSGMVKLEGRGLALANVDAALPIGEESDPRHVLIAAIAQGRQHGDLPASVTEADLMRRFNAPRADVAGALRHLAGLGVVERKLGFGWRFAALADSAADKRACYRFRLLVEPAALLEPGYAADPAWIASMQACHARYLARRWQAADAIAFFEMNAAFHLGLATYSGNRFLAQAVAQQNALRRLRNYSWRLGEERVRISCSDHLAILEAVADKAMERAAELMRRHLTDTASLVAGNDA